MFTNLGEVDDDRAVLLRVVAAVDRAEVVADLLFQLGATSIEEPRPGELVAGFANRSAAAAALAGLSPDEQVGALVDVPDDTWFDGWRAYAQPSRAGRRLVICPTWVPYEPAPGELVVPIDPGRSFGSGSHPTTRLVLAALEGAIDRGARHIADVGSGSGVVSVAAGLLGATAITAVDIDPVARESTRANLGRSGIAADVVAALGPGPFDVAVANIGARAVIDLAPALQARASLTIVAGFFVERADDVAAAYTHCHVVDRTTEAGWACLSFRRNTQPAGA